MDGNNISHDQIASSSNLKGMLKTDNTVAFLKMHVTLPVLLLGCSFVSTLVSLIAIPISKTFVTIQCNFLKKRLTCFLRKI